MEKVLESGALLKLSLCSFEEGTKLMKVVARELKNTRISRDEEVINVIKNLVTTLIASNEIEEALWSCIERGTYDGIHIKRDIFEDEKARADYIPILREALVFNLSPFFKSLKSLVKDLQVANISIPK
jgi:hypothetical protein